MRKSKRERERQEALDDLYVERYKRVKDERKGLLTTLTGLSGGAVVLSITFLEKIAPHKHIRGLIIAAWCSLGLTILIRVFGSLGMIFRSQQYQRELRELRELGQDQ